MRKNNNKKSGFAAFCFLQPGAYTKIYTNGQKHENFYRFIVPSNCTKIITKTRSNKLIFTNFN